MTIGRNPHVAKARVAEQKAELAGDAIGRARAHRDAAHQWERASEREKPGKLRDAYAAHAERNRALADAKPSPGDAFDDLPRFLAQSGLDDGFDDGGFDDGRFAGAAVDADGVDGAPIDPKTLN